MSFGKVVFGDGGGEACGGVFERRAAEAALLFSAVFWSFGLHEGILLFRFCALNVVDMLRKKYGN